METKSSHIQIHNFMNRINEIIKANEEQTKTSFKPTLDFFKFIGIGRKRFYQIVRNEVSPTFEEMQRLSDYFNVDILELHESTIKYLSDEYAPLKEKTRFGYLERLGLVKS